MIATRHVKIPLPVWVIAAFALAVFMIFLHLGAAPLLNPDEGRNASIALEMQQAGTWLVPTYNGLPYLDKPAFFFKAVALSLSVFGHSEWAARLPSALFASGLLLCLFAFCRREYNLKTAAMAVAVVGSAPLFLIFARFVIFDMALAFFVCAALFSGYLSEVSEGRARTYWSLMATAAMGFATLVKGPVGFIIPLLVLAVFNYTERKQKTTLVAESKTVSAFRQLFSWQNGLVFLLIVLPWFFGLSYLQHDFPYYGLVRETLLRFTTPTFQRTQPFYFYIPVLFVSLLFWSLLLPQTLWSAWLNRKQLACADRFFIIWAMVVFIFFSFSQSKLPGYVLTAGIALMVLVARMLIKAIDGHKKLSVSAWILALFYSVFMGILYVFQAHPEWIDGAHPRTIEMISIAFILHQSIIPILLSAGVVISTACMGAIKKNNRLILAAFVLAPVVVFIHFQPVWTKILEFRSDKLLAGVIQKEAPGLPIAFYGCYPPGIRFYLGHNVTVFTENNAEEIRSNYIPFSLSSLPVWPSQIQKASHLTTWLLEQHKPVFMISRTQAPLLPYIANQLLNAQQFSNKDNYWGIQISPTGNV